MERRRAVSRHGVGEHLCPLRGFSDVTWRGVGVVGGWQVTASLCFYAIFAATAFVRESFGVSRTLVGVSLTATLAGYTAFLFLTGAAVDGYGERPVMVVGLAALAAGMVGVAFASSFPLLLLALAVVGGAYATAMPATNRAVLVVAPDGRRNLAMNVKQVGVTAGSGLGALLVTTAAGTRYGWRVGFGVAAVLAVCVAVVFALTYRGREGSGVLAPPDVRGLAGLDGYRPLVAAGFFFGAAVFSTTGYVVLHLTESVGAAAAFGGLVLASVQVTGSVGRLVGGSAADWLPGDDARSSARVLIAQALCAVVAFGGVVVASSPPTAGVAFAVLGLFILGFPGVYYACLTALVPDDQVGAATAGGQTALNLGGLATPPVFGYLADTLSYDAGWTLLAGCTFAAGVLLVGLARDEHA
jgi:predicted MFS family arabinose efflux permease